MLAAAEAGVLSLVMTNPIWVVKTRLCLQYSEESLTDNKRYKGMIDGLMKIYRTEGIRGLYRVSGDVFVSFFFSILVYFLCVSLRSLYKDDPARYELFRGDAVSPVAPRVKHGVRR